MSDSDANDAILFRSEGRVRDVNGQRRQHAPKACNVMAKELMELRMERAEPPSKRADASGGKITDQGSASVEVGGSGDYEPLALLRRP
jgi:hypothetical protein